MIKENPVSPSVRELLNDPLSTKDQAYQLGYDAGRLQGIIESNETLDKIFAERLAAARS